MAELVQAATVICLRESGGELQVLLGQNMVKNWLRSTEESTVIMRYPGEWKFPGGGRDHDEKLVDTARRELEEEFLVVPRVFIAREFNVVVTRPIQGRSYEMHNFVAHAKDNPWLATFDISAVNAQLQARELAVTSSDWWDKSEADRLMNSPEVHEVAWIGVHEAVKMMGEDAHKCVNDWQRKEFELYGIEARDPMYQTMRSLLLVLEEFPIRVASQL